MANLDATAKRFYPGILCGLLGTIAFLQGSGISSLVAEQLPAGPPSASSALKPSLAARPPQKSAQVILARNAFDSVTGPLDKPKPVAHAPPPAPITVETELPRCAAASVVGITESDDPSFSFALIRSGGAAKMRRIGDDVDGKKLETINWDSVVLSSGETRCQLRMMDEAAGKATAGAAPEPARPTRTPAKPSGDSDIIKISENEYVIERNGPQKMQQLQQAFMKAARVVDGQGVRLQRSSQTTILGQLGMQKGDLVKTVNGYDMTNPDKSMEAYGVIKTAKKVQVVLERDGKPVTLDVTLK